VTDVAVAIGAAVLRRFWKLLPYVRRTNGRAVRTESIATTLARLRKGTQPADHRLRAAAVNRHRLLAVISALGFGAAVGLPLSATATVAPSSGHTTPTTHTVKLLQESGAAAG